MTLRSYIELPDLPSSQVLNPERGAFSLIVPEATTNLFPNPSFETNTTGWAAVGGSIARSTTQQRYGAYSLAVTPTSAAGDGVYYGTLTLTSGTTYTASISVYAPAGMPLKFFFATIGGVALATKTFVGTGRWQRIAITYKETSTTTRQFYLIKDNSAKTGTFYIDGMQVEARAYATTYCDGDQQGLVPAQYPPAYLWNGTAHASTSTRSAQTRDGGKVVNLDAYGFRVTAHVGLGLPPPNNITMQYGQLDGVQYQQTLLDQRTFTLKGRFDAARPAQLARLRSDLYSDLSRDKTSVAQPLVLLYQEYDELTPIGDEVKIIALYTGGLENTSNNRHGEDATISFMMPDPLITGGSGGSVLDAETEIASVNYIIQRNAAGTWAAMGTGLNDIPYDFVIAKDGTLYVCGNFTTAGGNTANRIAKWDGSAWSTLGTGFNGGVLALALAADGTLYAGGAFTTAGGGAAAGIAKWNGSAWSALGTGLTGGAAQCFDIVIAQDGTVYACGSFTTAGGGAANRIAKWNGAAWSALSTGFNDVANEMAFAQDGSLYVTGQFTTAGGTSASCIAKWNGSAWSALGAGLTDYFASPPLAGTSLTFGLDGTLYVIGNFLKAGGIDVHFIAQWNGNAWAPVGNGIGGYLNEMIVRTRHDGTLLLGHRGWDLAGIGDNSSIWTGSDYVIVDAELPGSGAPKAYIENIDGSFYMGLLVSGTASTPTIATVTNDGTARTYPRITITGPASGRSRIFQFTNYTTNKAVYFNYQISAGETIVLNLEPDNITCVSTWQGNILRYILGGSNRTEMYLIPGDNIVSFHADDDTVTIVMDWRRRYNSTDDTIY